MNTILLLMAMVCQKPADKEMFSMFPTEITVKQEVEKVPKVKLDYSKDPVLRKDNLYYLRDKNGMVWSNPNKQHLVEDVEKINSTTPQKEKPKKFCRGEDRFGRTWQADSPEELKKSLDRANNVNQWPAQRYNEQMTYAPQTSSYFRATCPPGASA